ncbi:MAG: lauroyl acyltransferase [Hyphomicrobiales bacterium]
MTKAQEPQPPISHRFELYGLKFLRAILLALRIDAASWVMGKVWRLIGPLNVRHKRVLRHMEWALGDETTPLQRDKIARDMWENLGRTFAEALIVDKIVQDRSRIQVDQAVLSQWTNSGDKAAVFMSHHFGNWELNAVPALWHTDHDVLGVYKRVKNRLVEDWFKSIRDELYKGGLYTESDKPARTILQKLRKGVSFAMISDLRDGKGVDVDLFGMPTKVSIFPTSLAVKVGLPVFLTQIRRTNGANFTLDMVKIDIEKSGDQQHDIETLTQACHSQFEEWIKDQPEQWMWAPYRWKGRYEGDEKPMSWTKFNAKNETAGSSSS